MSLHFPGHRAAGAKSLELDIGLTLPMSMLLAATVSSTDSASVFNLLRTQHIGLKHNLRPMLELESGSNDPMAYVLTIALVIWSLAATALMVPSCISLLMMVPGA